MQKSRMIDVLPCVGASPSKERENGARALLVKVQDSTSRLMKRVQALRCFPNVVAPFPRGLALLMLACTIAVPIYVARGQENTDTSSGSGWKTITPDSHSNSGWKNITPDSQTQETTADPPQQPPATAREGFWGSREWLKQQLDPINDRLSELDEVNAMNARDIKDVGARVQARIEKAQSAADAANKVAMSAHAHARSANNAAQMASNRVEQLKGTLNRFDQYHRITDLEVTFRGHSPELSADSKTKLDQLASSLTGRGGYTLEMDAFAPGAGSVGIQGSERLAETVEGYLVTKHQIPAYRMHFVALGNQELPGAGRSDEKREGVKAGSVHLMLMENNVATPAAVSQQSASASAGTEQP